MEFQYACYSDIGKRNNNEDAWGVANEQHAFLAVVADGLGGHANGEVASQIAVSTLCSRLREKRVDEDSLAYAIMDTSRIIREETDSSLTTVAVFWGCDHCGVAAHVGDSRIYQFRDGQILYQSVDHSIVQMAVLVGELPADAVRYHKDRSKLFCAIGEETAPRVDSVELQVKHGDRLLLCSDGFWEPVTEEEMLMTAQKTDTPQQWLDAMRKTVITKRDPRQDNNTAICILVK